jgi:pimeloyl-ACP methyl ester carboxylesterase
MHLARLGLLLIMPLMAFSAPPPGVPDGWSDGYVYANGIRLHYYRAAPAPGKPVIVMVHGVTDIGLSWTTLTWKLQDEYDVYMLDTRAHGLSDPFTPADDGDTLVKDLVAFVDAINLEKPILMGHSMGAATVMRLGAEYPDLASAIVMLDPLLGRMRAPPPMPETSATGENGRPTPPPAPDRLPVSMRGTPETLVAQNNYAFDDLVATCRRQSPMWDVVDCQYWALSKKQYHGAYTEQAWEVMSGVMRIGDSLAKIVVPALVLKADAPADVRKANEQAASAMHNGRLVHLEGAGHNLHHDKLNETATLLTEFLSSLEGIPDRH